MVVKRLCIVFAVFIFCCASPVLKAQKFLADYDSTFFISDTLRTLIKRFQNPAIPDHLQPQFQVAQIEAAARWHWP